MTGWPRHYRRLWALLLPLLAATLACNALAGGGASPAGALTQAAATVQAAANLAATTQAAIPTVARASSTAPARPPTAAPAAATTATPAASPTAVGTAALTATAAVTPAASPTISSTAQSGTAIVLDPCSLLTADEARALVGVDLQPARQQGGGCLYSDAFVAHGLAVYALPPSQSQNFFLQYAASLKQAGLKLDPALEAKLGLDSAAGDLVAATTDLLAMTAGQAKYNAQKIDGLGSVALWSYSTLTQLQVVDVVLIAARPGGLVAMSLVVAAPADPAKLLATLQPFVSRLLDGLPPDFVVKGLQIAGSAPAIDPCALATADEVQAILGVKPAAGQPAQGQCAYLSPANAQIQVRVFALPPGEGATEVITQLESTLLAGGAATKAKVDADVKAGDLVAAVSHLSGASANFLGKPEPVDGLGAAAFFFLAAPGGGSKRIGYLVAAKPGALVGLSLFLGPGDSAATKTAGVALVTKILNNLPEKFTVTGAP